MTRVLIITTNFPRWEGDPHSPWLLELMARLEAQGVEFDVLAPSFQGMRTHTIGHSRVYRFRYAPARWETLTHEDGAPAKIRRNPLYLLLLPLYLLSGMWYAWRLGRHHNYDVIHVHWPVPQGIFGVLAQRSTRARLVATFYGADLVMAQRFPGVQSFVRWFVARCDDYAAISSYTAQALASMTDRTPRIVPYGIHLPPEKDWPATPGRILTVGRLIPRKGHLYLIRAMAQLRDLEKAHLVIVGDGQERTILEAEIQQLGLDDRVVLAGRVSDEALDAYYRSCEVFVLPAIVDASGDTEMLGMVSLEAMRYCKPVVASHVGGIPDIVVHGQTGLLVPQKDPEALAAAIRQLLQDPALARAYGHAGYRVAHERFSWDAVTRSVLAMYGAL